MGQRCWVLRGERREWLDLRLTDRLSLCTSREGPHGDHSLAPGTGSALDTLGEVHPECALCSVELSQVLSLAAHWGRLVQKSKLMGWMNSTSGPRPESEGAVPQEPCSKKLNSSDPSIMQSALLPTVIVSPIVKRT